MGENFDIFHFSSLIGEADLVHGVFGRAGGVSLPPWDSLNVGRGVGDSADAVRENHARICAALGVSSEDLVTVRQVHSNRVQRVGAADKGRIVGELDGLVTNEPGVPLILRFADCVPILLYDPIRKALGVAHAGWRGTLSRIGARLVEAMTSEFGCRPSDIIAGLGPSIGPCCYQVGPDVIQATAEAFAPEVQRSDGWPLIFSNNGATYLDLWAANRLVLEVAGVERVEIASICTACRKDRFFSHRGDGGRTGRFAMVAMLKARLA